MSDQTPSPESEVEGYGAREILGRVEGIVEPGLRAAHSLGHRVESGVILPAWRRVTTGEPRWPVSLGVLAAIAMQLALPQRMTFHPRWLLPVLELVLLAVLIALNPGRIEHRAPHLRVLTMLLVVTISAANVISAGRLITGLVRGTEALDAGPLLLIGAAIWLTNVIAFSLWYWELDRGGPVDRAHGVHAHPDFVFPQMQNPEFARPDWEPAYVDYLYLSFTNATAFSPTDVLPFALWAKLTMLLQSAISLATVALVIARAVNILK